jgi:hypothetical protein
MPIYTVTKPKVGRVGYSRVLTRVRPASLRSSLHPSGLVYYAGTQTKGPTAQRRAMANTGTGWKYEGEWDPSAVDYELEDVDMAAHVGLIRVRPRI